MKPFLTIRHSSGTTPLFQLDSLPQAIPLVQKSLARVDHCAVMTSPLLMKLYANQLKQLMTAVGAAEPLLLPDGEKYKTVAQADKQWQQMAELGLSRHSALIAIGGGVVTDLAGFVAAGYMRGIKTLYIPTTLLGQVDASLGGKTGVNLPNGKNLVGFFHQPTAVLLCMDLLTSLNDQEMANGYAEIIKAALIADESFFSYLEEYFAAPSDSHTLAETIRHSCAIKVGFIEQDEQEAIHGSGKRALLNLGHTFGHALEARHNYKAIKHGEAVALGIGLAAAISVKLGHLTDSDCQRIRQLLANAGLPTQLPPDFEAATMVDYMQRDKKKHHDGIPLILLSAIGKAYLSEPYSPTQIMAMVEKAMPLLV